MALSALLLATMIGFAAEPSTSTELDRVEGRAYAGVVHARIGSVQAPSHVSPLPTRALAIVLAAVVALACVASRRRALLITAAPIPRSLPWWAVRARRGPPALV